MTRAQLAHFPEGSGQRAAGQPAVRIVMAEARRLRYVPFAREPTDNAEARPERRYNSFAELEPFAFASGGDGAKVVMKRLAFLLSARGFYLQSSRRVEHPAIPATEDTSFQWSPVFDLWLVCSFCRLAFIERLPAQLDDSFADASAFLVCLSAHHQLHSLACPFNSHSPPTTSNSRPTCAHVQSPRPFLQCLTCPRSQWSSRAATASCTRATASSLPSLQWARNRRRHGPALTRTRRASQCTCT